MSEQQVVWPTAGINSTNAGMADSGAALGASDVGHAVEGGMVSPKPDRRGRRCRRPRHKHHQTEENPPIHHGQVLVGNGRDASPVPPARDDGVPLARGPPCVIDLSDQLARVEADLRTAVLITVFGSDASRAINDIEKIKSMVASSFNLDRDSLVLKLSHMESVFILFAGDEENGGMPDSVRTSIEIGGVYGCTANDGQDRHSLGVLPCHPW